MVQVSSILLLLCIIIIMKDEQLRDTGTEALSRVRTEERMEKKMLFN